MEFFGLTEVSQLGGICHLVTAEMVLSQIVFIVGEIAGIGNQVFNELQAIADIERQKELGSTYGRSAL